MLTKHGFLNINPIQVSLVPSRPQQVWHHVTCRPCTIGPGSKPPPLTPITQIGLGTRLYPSNTSRCVSQMQNSLTHLHSQLFIRWTPSGPERGSYFINAGTTILNVCISVTVWILIYLDKFKTVLNIGISVMKMSIKRSLTVLINKVPQAYCKRMQKVTLAYKSYCMVQRFSLEWFPM